jgi:tetratricopeptide (TPR) repeat protein
MTMDELDLVNDDPEDYPGKLVRVDGALYRIGGYVGSGAERIVHELTNVESGLTLHLIKILRDQGHALQTANQTRDNLGELRRDGWPTVEDSIIVQAHSGVFEVDEGASEGAGESGAAMERASNLWEQHPSSALDIIAGVLEANGSHTEALHLMARINAACGDVQRALELEIEVLGIEPNVRPYKFMFMEWAGRTGLIKGLLSQFDNLKLKWPNDHTTDGLAVRAYLALGQPERSREVLDKSVPELQGELGPSVQSALHAKRTAMRKMNGALTAFQAHDLESSLRALERAHSIYPEYPFVRANFGLAKFRAGNWDQAANALVLAAQVVPIAWKAQCFASAAFAAIMGEHYEKASTLLGFVLQDLEDQAEGRQVQPADVPGLAEWIDPKAVLMERSDSPVRLVERVIQHFQTKGEAPSHLQTLAVLFRQASEMITGC